MKNGKLETHEIVGFILSKGWLSTKDLQSELANYGIFKTDKAVRNLKSRYEDRYVQFKCVERRKEATTGEIFYATLYFGNHFTPTLEQITAFGAEFNEEYPLEAPKEKWYHKIWAWFIGISS